MIWHGENDELHAHLYVPKTNDGSCIHDLNLHDVDTLNEQSRVLINAMLMHKSKAKKKKQKTKSIDQIYTQHCHSKMKGKSSSCVSV